jgi:hypothetical protein
MSPVDVDGSSYGRSRLSAGTRKLGECGGAGLVVDALTYGNFLLQGVGSLCRERACMTPSFGVESHQ